MSDNELDSLMMQADIANQEARERFACAVCDPDVPNPDVDWCNVCSARLMPAAPEIKRQRDDLLATLKTIRSLRIMEQIERAIERAEEGEE